MRHTIAGRAAGPLMRCCSSDVHIPALALLPQYTCCTWLLLRCGMFRYHRQPATLSYSLSLSLLQLLDAACGMLYLHYRSVPVLHRDLVRCAVQHCWPCLLGLRTAMCRVAAAAAAAAAAVMHARSYVWAVVSVLGGRPSHPGWYSAGLLLSRAPFGCARDGWRCHLHQCTLHCLVCAQKSPNILVDENWRGKVADFNLSRVMEDPKRTSSIAAMNPVCIACTRRCCSV